MDTVTLASAATVMRSGQMQQALSTTMMKQVAAQQGQLAEILAQNIQQAPQAATQSNSNFNFSTYA